MTRHCRQLATPNAPLQYQHRIVAFGLIAIAAIAAPASAGRQAQIPPKSERAREIRLTDETVTIPIVMVEEFPFITGSVDETEGKFMLDTGMEGALTINDHRVPTPQGRTIGRGFFGSGQSYDVKLLPELRDIRIGSLHFPRATMVQAQDARLLEGITPDFIGWLGYGSFATHALKLDYRALRVTFYKGNESDYLKGERLIAALPFETRRLPNHPVIMGQVGGLAVVTTWDTGQNGSLYTNAATKARMIKTGRLRPSRGAPELYDLHGLRLHGHLMPPISGIDVETTPSPAAEALGISEPTEVSVGYSLLRQFKTVWDFQRRRIYLLAR